MTASASSGLFSLRSNRAAVLSEGARPAHENPEQAAASVRAYVEATLDELADMPAGELVRKRHERFAKF